jgi:hypothetical protein
MKISQLFVILPLAVAAVAVPVVNHPKAGKSKGEPRIHANITATDAEVWGWKCPEKKCKPSQKPFLPEQSIFPTQIREVACKHENEAKYALSPSISNSGWSACIGLDES